MSMTICQYLKHLGSSYWHSYVFTHIQDGSYGVEFSCVRFNWAFIECVDCAMCLARL